jgi:CubicO group peptidase (beta-lactamase class C family)
MRNLLEVTGRYTTRRKVVAGAVATLVAGLDRIFPHAKAETMNASQFSKEGLQRLHKDLAGYVAAGDRPGFVMLVSKNGETHVDAIGTHELKGGTPMRRDTIFRIASITKPITGAVTMRLIEEGKLSLDEPIDRLIPELANRRVLKQLNGPLDDTVPAKRPILVSDLLTMRMGMGAIMSPDPHPIQVALMQEGVFTPFYMPTTRNADEWIAKLATFPLMNQPGEVWRYDTSITLLGALIERTTGKPLGDVFEELILGPLGMTDTGFVVPSGKLDRLPTAYQKNQQTGKLEVWDPSGEASFFAKQHGFPGAHGGLVSTVDDYFAFAQMMMNKGRHGNRQVLSAKSVELMMTDHIPADVKAHSTFIPGFWDLRGWGYGGSIIKKHEPGEPRGFGWDGGYGLVAYWDATSGVIALLFSQRLVTSPFYDEIFKKFFNGVYAAASV